MTTVAAGALLAAMMPGWRPSFARSEVPKLGGLERDLEHYLAFYDTERAHTGRYTQGRTPWQTLVGARKMRPR